MKSTFTLLSCFCMAALGAQVFNSPESVEYDGANGRWLVDDNGANTIVSFYPQTNTTTLFSSAPTSGPHGAEILGNVVYVCDGGYIRGYDLATGTGVFNLNLGATFLNGITTDGVSNLFATDFTGKKIYRINPATNSYNIMTATVKTPNGIYYDGANSRCVFVTWGSNAPIQAMSLVDSTISTVGATTLSNCDGITRDNAGYWYVSAWGTNSLNRFTPAFTGQTSVMTGLSGPADLDINTAGDSIAIPNSNSTTVVFYTGITTGIENAAIENKLSVYPNPANAELHIGFGDELTDATLQLFDARGRCILEKNVSGNALLLETNTLENGVYFLALTNTESNVVSRRQVVIAR